MMETVLAAILIVVTWGALIWVGAICLVVLATIALCLLGFFIRSIGFVSYLILGLIFGLPDRSRDCPVCGWGHGGIRDEGCLFADSGCPRTDVRFSR